MKVKVVVLPKRDFNYKLKLALNGGCKKRFEFFWALALEKTQIRHDLSPLLSRIFCRSLLFVEIKMTSSQSVFRSAFVFPSRVALL